MMDATFILGVIIFGAVWAWSICRTYKKGEKDERGSQEGR